MSCGGVRGDFHPTVRDPRRRARHNATPDRCEGDQRSKRPETVCRFVDAFYNSKLS